MTFTSDSDGWGFTLGMYDMFILFMIWLYWQISSNILYHKYLFHLNIGDNDLFKTSKNKYHYNILQILFKVFGFIVYLPFIKNILTDIFEHKLNIHRLDYLYESKYHNMEGAFDDEIKILKRKILLRKLRN